ncbi:MAG TPA: hypothetical protein VKX96_17430 [Chloroflexota bacterium]|jgi:hypothetical protein|nr:hypothetical protein [Chloroflexota bacterium]
MEKFALTLWDYGRDHQWVRLLGWTEDELRATPIHYEATSASDYLNLANFGNTALGVSSVAGGGTSAHTRALQNVYVYQSDTPAELYERLQRLMDQEGPDPYPPRV